MTSCSIRIMATGNKCVIVCPGISEKMFPFVETPSCLLPVGNTTLLEKLLRDVSNEAFDEIIVLAAPHAGIKRLTRTYHARLCELQSNVVQQLQEELMDCEHMVILYGNTWLDRQDLQELLHLIDNDMCAALVKPYEAYEKAMDGFGVDADKSIHAIYAHPRAHYVNGRLCRAYVWNAHMREFAMNCENGFHNVNCGQMPDTAYYPEEAMQRAIEHGVCFQSLVSTHPFVELLFPWDIARVNELACRQLEDMHADQLQEDTLIDDTCIRHGYLKTGSDVVIQDGVILEGNCWIGNHVRIEKGAIIGKNCMIQDGSVVRYQCRISDHTVIGTNNKIGYHAEISGVTFDGVCAVHGSEVFGVIGKKVDIAAGVQMAILRFDDNFVSQRIQGKTYSNPYTNRIFIGDYCRTGVGNIFLPGVKVGSRSAIGPGVLVEKDIKENTLIIQKQETLEKEWGSQRYGW